MSEAVRLPGPHPQAPFVGVDIGTTHVKAVLFAPDRGILAVARRPTPTRRLPDGSAHHPPEALLGAVESVIAECAAAGPEAPSSIGLASMSEAGVALDAEGRSLGDIIAWFDPGAAGQAAWLGRTVGQEALFARTGLRPQAKSTLARWLWLRRFDAERFGRLRAWAGVAELAGHALTGSLATNASLACRTLAFDVRDRAWDAELLALAGLEPDQLPEVLPLGRPVGGLTAGAAARLGLASGTPVAIAGHDHLVGAFGAGVVRPGEVLDSVGSAEVSLLATARPALADELRRAGYSSGCHAVDDTWYVLGSLQASGALTEWLVDEVLLPAAAIGSSRRPPSDDERYAMLLELLDRATAAPAEILVAPYLRGRTAPSPDGGATLEIAGLQAGHTLADVALAIVQAAAFHVRWMLDELERLTASRAGSIRLIGGGTRNPPWLRAKAALWPGRVGVARTDEAVALGAALVAGLAAGAFGSLDEALGHAAPVEMVAVDPEVGDRFERAYAERWLPWIMGRGEAAGSSDRPARPDC